MLGRRNPFDILCPNDQSWIPQVAEVRDGVEPVRFFWCWSCAELFAFVGNPWSLAVRFGRDGNGWRIFRSVGSDPEVQIAMTAVSQVALPAELRLRADA
jgi:hypothetical protein